jgi:hypothetical protein
MRAKLNQDSLRQAKRANFGCILIYYELEDKLSVSHIAMCKYQVALDRRQS